MQGSNNRRLLQDPAMPATPPSWDINGSQCGDPNMAKWGCCSVCPPVVGCIYYPRPNQNFEYAPWTPVQIKEGRLPLAENGTRRPPPCGKFHFLPFPPFLGAGGVSLLTNCCGLHPPFQHFNAEKTLLIFKFFTAESCFMGNWHASIWRLYSTLSTSE